MALFGGRAKRVDCMSERKSPREGIPFLAGRLLGLGSLVSLGVLIITLVNVSGASYYGWEIDEVGTVTRVVDGDTFDAAPVGRVRLADINTPEVGRLGAREATDHLSSLIRNRVVYLDVDDVYGSDVYGRVVAVVYVRHNATHLLNVNEALLEAGLARVADFPNEFDPRTWTLYAGYPTTEGITAEAIATSPMAVTAIIVIAIVTVSLGILPRRRRGQPPAVVTTRGIRRS